MRAAPVGKPWGRRRHPYTAKDSYLVKGLTAASGSPAFKDLRPSAMPLPLSACAAGAICLGKTNMPPMANGGMQRGVYGRAESPHNADYLTAPLASGSPTGRHCHRCQLLPPSVWRKRPGRAAGVPGPTTACVPTPRPVA